MKHSYDLTTGSITKHLLRLSLPLILGNILQQLYNTIDAFILGHYAGEAEFAAVGIAGSIMNLFLFLITGACTGISIIFAQLYGSGDRNAFRREHWLSLTFGMLVTAFFSLFGRISLPWILQAIHTPNSLTTLVSDYLHIILLSLVAAFLYNLYSALLRSVGRTSAALMALSAAVAVNLVLDYILVARLHLGIVGAAWATAAAQGISALLCILYLWRTLPELLFHRSDCHIDSRLLRQTAHFSFITGLHQSSLYIGKLFVQGAVNTGGTAMITAYTATTRIEGFANSFGDSGSSATSVLVAQNRGAGKKERTQQTFRTSFVLMLILGLTMSVILYTTANLSSQLMLGATSGKSFDNAVSYLRIIALFYTFCYTGNTFAGYYDGIGKVNLPFLGSLSHIALRVLLSWLLVGQFGLPAVAFATGIGWIFVNVLWAICKHHISLEP